MRSFARTFAARIDKEREGDGSSEQVLDRRDNVLCIHNGKNSDFSHMQ